MSEGEAETAAADAPAAAPAPTEALDQTRALKEVLKTALAHDGLARGLHEACRAIEQAKAQMAVIAMDCDQPDYIKLVKSLCAEKSVDVVMVETKAVLGEMAGLCKLDAEGNPTKVVNCSCAVVLDYGDDTEALKVLKSFIKKQKGGEE